VTEAQPPEDICTRLSVIGFGIGWKLPLFDFFLVPAKCLECVGLEVGIGLDEFGDKLVEEPEKIVEHENLSVAIGTSTNADRWDRELVGYSTGYFDRDRFQHQREGSGSRKGLCIIHECLGLVFSLTLHFISTKLVD